ncbi:MAG: hypothetical protein CML06_02730 [Pseudomonadales bacterium]|nr:hypothetical protein [Pseudomonadales bacterium]|tara:strand:+ start:194 stop:397 length:204 start_codon:yes stop_codon:yes gene_type:complete
MAEFYIEKQPQNTGAHLVHFSHCQGLSELSGLNYLGSIASYDSAWKEAKKLYHEVSACPACAGQYAG